MSQSKVPISQQVAHKIKDERLRPKSRWAVIGEHLLLLFLGFCIFILSVLMLNIVLYTMRVSGLFYGVFAGGVGFRALLSAFPYTPLIIGLLLLIGAIIVVRQFDISYKHPTFIVFGGLIFSMLVFSSLLSISPLNLRLADEARGGHLPQPLNQWYREEFGAAHGRYTVIGQVKEVGDGYLILETNGEDVTLTYAQETRFIHGKKPAEGDWVRAFGQRQGLAQFSAQAISVLPHHSMGRERRSERIMPRRV